MYSQEQRAELRGELESLNIKIGNNDGNMGMLKGMKNKMELQIEAEGEVERTIVVSWLLPMGEIWADSLECEQCCILLDL